LRVVRGYRASKIEGDFYPRLILVTDRHRCEQGRLVEVIERCLEEGLDTVMLREKDLPGGQMLEMATEIRRVTSGHNAKLIVNDRMDVAIVAEADGVHLGNRSFRSRDLKNRLPENMLVGASAHNMDEALEAQNDGADYIILSPVFATSSKPGAKPLGVGKMKDIISRLRVPTYALGGVKQSNAQALIEAGAKGVAVISAILDHPRPHIATGIMLQAMERVTNDTT